MLDVPTRDGGFKAEKVITHKMEGELNKQERAWEPRLPLLGSYTLPRKAPTLRNLRRNCILSVPSPCTRYTLYRNILSVRCRATRPPSSSWPPSHSERTQKGTLCRLRLL
jgi:hypothetical protein